MSPREKILASLIAAVILLVGGVSLVRSRLVEPLNQKRATLRQLNERRGELELRLAHEAATRNDWQDRTKRMIATGAFEAEELFRSDLAQMLRNAGLADVSLRPRAALVTKKGFREGFIEVPFSINAQGTLDQVVGFLREFYQRPYYVRISELSLSAVQTGAAAAARRGANRRGGADEPLLNVIIVASTLVLPETPGIKPVPLDPNQITQPDTWLLAQADLNSYNDIATVNLFRLYEPPKPTPPRPDPPVAQNTERPTPPVAPPRDPRADMRELRLAATTSTNGDLVAWIVRKGAYEAPQPVRLNEVFDDGKLVLIHPTGIVIRVLPEGDPQSPPTDYFYVLGAEDLYERVVVDPAEHPDIARDLQRAFARRE